MQRIADDVTLIYEGRLLAHGPTEPPEGTIWQQIERRKWLLTVHGFSADTLAYLPISRGKAVLSQALVALGLLSFIWTTNVGIYLAMNVGETDLRGITIIGAVSLCMFGVAWFVSAIASSHALAAAVGVLIPSAIAMGTMGVCALAGWSEASAERWLLLILAATGVGGFLGGIRYYLWRVEP